MWAADSRNELLRGECCQLRFDVLSEAYARLLLLRSRAECAGQPPQGRQVQPRKAATARSFRSGSGHCSVCKPFRHSAVECSTRISTAPHSLLRLANLMALRL